MNHPYHSRLLLQAPDHEPIELCRFKRPISTYDRKHWLRDIAREWRVIEERICGRTIAPRVRATPVASSHNNSAMLTPEERGEIVYGPE